MHGRVKKDIVEPTPEEKEKQRQQVRTAKALFGKLLEQRQARVYNAQALDMTMKALQFHPEFPTLWGYRRELIQNREVSTDLEQTLEVEMKLLEKALRKSQKVYSIWFHRKWVVDQLFEVCASSAEAQHVLDVELELCGRLLEVDERNFHCWNHRSHVMGLMLRQQRQPPAVSDAVVPEVEAAAEEAPAPAVPAAEDTEEAHRPAAEGSEAKAEAGPPAPAVEVSEAKAEAPGAEEASRAPAAPAADTGAAPPPAAEAIEAMAATAGPDPASTAGEPVDLTQLDLSLSKELINRNFSNYSAWHLRVLVQQSPGDREAGTNSTDLVDVSKELDWVQQGIYTEPNDQSIWLYHHWLTIQGRGSQQLRITHVALLGDELFVFFSGPACPARGDGEAAGGDGCGVFPTLTMTLRDAPPEVVPGTLEPLGTRTAARAARTRALPGGRRRWAQSWRFVPTAADGSGAAAPTSALADRLRRAGLASVELVAGVEACGTDAEHKATRECRSLVFKGLPVLCDVEDRGTARSAAAAFAAPAPDAVHVALLRAELAKVEELLELEPDCKWALLSRSRLGAASADGCDVAALTAAQEACAAGYERIMGLDPPRRGFYLEAKAECLARLRILGWLGSAPAAPLDLAGLGLRHVAPMTMLAAFGVRVLKVSSNCLQTLAPLLSLLSLVELDASENELLGDASEVFALPRLRRANLGKNNLSLRGHAEQPLPPQLEDVDLSANPRVVALASPSVVLERLLAGMPAGTSAGTWDVDLDAPSARCRATRRG